MAGFSITTSALPLLMVIASCHCGTYSFSAIFGGESHLNLTSTGYGTLKSKDAPKSGIGGVWNATVYGGGYGNHNNLTVGAVASANKVVSLKPGESISEIKSNDTTFGGKLFFGENAKRLADSIDAGDTSLITNKDEDDDEVDSVEIDTTTKSWSDYEMYDFEESHDQI